jgi:hypothetical protein
MPSSNFTYSNGQSRVVAQSDPTAVPAGGDGGDGYGAIFSEIIREQMERKRRMDDMRESLARKEFNAEMFQGTPEAQRAKASGMGAASRPAPVNRSREADPFEAQRRALQMRAAEAELQAQMNPAPTRMVHGAGIMSGRTLDPLAMNAFQRRAYLPNESQTITGPGSGMSGSKEWEQMGARNALAEEQPRYATVGRGNAMAPSTRYAEPAAPPQVISGDRRLRGYGF